MMDIFDKMEEELEYLELEYLRWFHCEVDFGPAHCDVMQIYQDEYEQTTGNKVPEDYDYRISLED